MVLRLRLTLCNHSSYLWLKTDLLAAMTNNIRFSIHSCHKTKTGAFLLRFCIDWEDPGD